MHKNKICINKSNEPVITVILPTYNRYDLLNRALRSVQAQDFKLFELIVIDDNSECDVNELVNNFKGLNVRAFRNSKNMGGAYSRDIGLKNARGKFVSFLDDDDEYEKTFLSATVKFLDDNKNVDLCWCNATINGCTEKGDNLIEHKEFPRNFNSEILMYEYLLSIGIGFGVTAKRELLLKVGGFNPKYRVVEDTDIFLRLIAERCHAEILPGKHIILNNHSKNRMTGIENNSVRIKECGRLLVEHEKILNEYPSLKYQIKKQMSLLGDQLMFVENKDIQTAVVEMTY